MWSIQTWCAPLVTLIESSDAPLNRMFRMITLLPGRVVVPSCRPPPVISAVPPTPTMLLLATTVTMPPTAIRPETRMVYGVGAPAYSASAAAVVTVTVGPAAPPVVPVGPNPATLAKPSG